MSLFDLLQSVPYLATISAGHRAGALTFLGHWVLGRSSFVGLSHNPKYSGFLLSSAGFCEPCHLFFALPVFWEPNLSDCLPQCEDLSNRQGFLPTSRPPYYMVAHGVRARGRYLIVCAESDYSTCDRPPSVAHVGVVGATISGWFGLVNPYRLRLLSHSLVSLGLRWCPQPLMLL